LKAHDIKNLQTREKDLEATAEKVKVEAEIEKAKAELGVMKRKLLESEREAEEANKARSGAEAYLTAVKKWESSVRHELKLADMALKKADKKKIQLQEQLTSVILRFLSSNAFKYAAQVFIQDYVK
jgi:predicted  nucleic acid-binding Zn-ribbon protein